MTTEEAIDKLNKAREMAQVLQLKEGQSILVEDLPVWLERYNALVELLVSDDGLICK